MCAGRESIQFPYTVTFDATGRVQELDIQMIGDVGFIYADSVGDMAMAVGFSDNVYAASPRV